MLRNIKRIRLKREEANKPHLEALKQEKAQDGRENRKLLSMRCTASILWWRKCALLQLSEYYSVPSGLSWSFRFLAR